ncbi:hypothetical protein AX16_003222 [Volvariella volvacea WC 439]|nr:hypothetical protein AX16_003222 [Volvariella volvacea WC 439]
MAKYSYDEGGNMATYFLISFLILVLVPSTILSLTPTKKQPLEGCQCGPCSEQRQRVNKRESSSLLSPKLRRKTIFLAAGWGILAFLLHKAYNAQDENKVYNPFEVLGIPTGLSPKEIKTHFKQLSRKFHPDKVIPSANQTLEDIQNRFVEITKAYKALTDDTIRENWERYGHPDGRQETSAGIALPKWIVESQNNIWVLGFYGLAFGGALPALVGRWWFGSRQRTKDGIHAQSAASFFKSLKEESTFDEVVATLGTAYQWERPAQATKLESDLTELEKKVESEAGKKWSTIKGFFNNQPARRRALVLLYAHLLRIPITNPALQNEQSEILLQSPLLLNALINIAIARNWLSTTLSVMRLHASLVQALLPGHDRLRLTQLPGIKADELETLAPKTSDIPDLVQALEDKKDGRLTDVKKAAQRWGRLELVEASFKVIGERIVVSSSIVYLLVKLRIAPPTGSQEEEKELSVEDAKKAAKLNEEKDQQFLTSRKEVEDLPEHIKPSGYAHAPLWPGNRKPSWWLVLADDKSNRIVVPPLKITDVPYSNPKEDRNYRSYKLQFQAPPNVGLFTWKIYIVSDTFVGEEITRDITLKIDDVSALNADEQVSEDEISDPDEDSLAGQMAVMRGQKVKKRDESDDESSTDDEGSGDDSSDSDSD